MMSGIAAAVRRWLRGREKKAPVSWWCRKATRRRDAETRSAVAKSWEECRRWLAAGAEFAEGRDE